VTVAKLQGSIESHVSRILDKTGKVSEDALKSQVNVAESNQGVEAKG